MQDAHLQEIQFGSAIHLSFNPLQAVDLTFRLAITPGQTERGYNRCLIGQKTADKAKQFYQTAGRHRGYSGVQVLGTVLADQRNKGIAQLWAC
jgi:hypothetical protein